MVFCVVNRSCGETRGSSCSRRRKASIFSLGQSERLAKVRWRVFLPSRQPSRRRMAGGELRLGTTAIYMRTLTNINPNLSREIYRYMRTQINENQVAARAKPHIFKILTSNRASTVGWNFGLAGPKTTKIRYNAPAVANQSLTVRQSSRGAPPDSGHESARERVNRENRRGVGATSPCFRRASPRHWRRCGVVSASGRARNHPDLRLVPGRDAFFPGKAPT